MKNTTAARLQQVMSERNLKQVDVISLSKVHQKELGVKLGKSALSQYINGKSTPDQEKLVLLARTLGVSEAWLMGYDTNESTDVKKESIDLSNLREKVVMFDGKPLSDDDVKKIEQIIRLSIEVTGDED
ncbi:prophage LambdaSa03, transcriptional regulator,Cro/CI family [Streptococcus salivarius JIM8777]|jgi:transcriptional regulator with XRE-family HTH domain|uniref:helix-turn-helix domain-containing protein n=1 Tax=Streptococcus salivarius TaxID=1304 RepID=UPI0002145E65|nr:helix-turn-helix domain-containing protein [Streptococcus salivarius]QBX30437.1 putative cI-like repressor [Streptococcus phage Javan536]CCB95230.1 prophage LambdaSa03, transcriptional regulator,Cro/CI family [Streptococcus salivarius JIM8777]